jgi:hypothetical protein
LRTTLDSRVVLPLCAPLCALVAFRDNWSMLFPRLPNFVFVPKNNPKYYLAPQI